MKMKEKIFNAFQIQKNTAYENKNPKYNESSQDKL